MILLVVNHHYVSAERAAEARAIFPVAVADLAARLEALSLRFEFCSRDDLLAAIDGRRQLPERSCLVTFDDGLRAQFELALPALVRLGIPALFLVPGRPLAEGRALFVHKLHAMRERVTDEELLHLLERGLAEMGRSLASVSAETAVAHYAYDAPEAARVKFLLNVSLPPEARERVVADAFARVVGDEETFCQKLYMSADQVAELEREHRAVGSHSYAHEPLALLEPARLRRELARSAAALARVAGRLPATISYPHGSREAVTPSVARAAEAAGFRVGFTMERAFNRTLEEPLLLARIDANDVPGGSRPLFDFRGDEPVVRPGMTAARERYLTETGYPARG